MESTYDDLDFISREVRAGRHRELIGGLWGEVGALQLAFMQAQGLKPEHALLDVGCGSLRGGVHFVRYLETNRYFGLDISPELLEAGYSIEIVGEGLGSKLPRNHLVATPNFVLGHDEIAFDFAIAQSLFSHFTLNRIRECLGRIAGRLRPGGKFFATYFEVPTSSPWEEPYVQTPAGIETWPSRDPYHYRFEDLVFAAGDTNWTSVRIGDWSHPRGQLMACFIRR